MSNEFGQAAYIQGRDGLEVIDVIEAFVPTKPYRWSPLKYLLRAGRKPGQDEVQDLRKAIWWIEREIIKIEEARAQADTWKRPEDRYKRGQTNNLIR